MTASTAAGDEETGGTELTRREGRRSLDDLRPPETRRAGPGDVDDIVAMLVRAFDDDPVTNFMFPVDRRRRRALAKFFTIQITREYLQAGEVWTVPDRAGAAVWGPPSKRRPKPSDGLHLLPVAPYLFAGGRRALPCIRTLVEIERRRPRTPHWYLATLGTEPARQGTGIGSALLRAVLAQVDEAGMPAYLESSKERNVGFYAHHGFEVVDELTVFGGGPKMWLMWRTPRPPAPAA